MAQVPDDPTTGEAVGVSLVPYFRHFLPIINLFKSTPKFASSKDDYSLSLGELMDDTLHLFATKGGRGAGREINRLIPLWSPPPGTR